jgi:hypothetical protein
MKAACAPPVELRFRSCFLGDPGGGAQLDEYGAFRQSGNFLAELHFWVITSTLNIGGQLAGSGGERWLRVAAKVIF